MRLLISSHFPFNKIGYSKQTREIVKSILNLCPNIKIGIICWDGWDLPVNDTFYKLDDFKIYLEKKFPITNEDYILFKNVTFFSGGIRNLNINNQNEVTKHWQIIKKYVDLFKADKLLVYQDIWIFESFDIDSIKCDKYLYLPVHNDFTSNKLLKYSNGINPEIKNLQFLPFFNNIATFSKFGIEVLRKYRYNNSIFINHIVNIPKITSSKKEFRI